MIEKFVEWEEKREDLDAVEKVLNTEVLRIVNIVYTFFRPYDRLVKGQWSGDQPSAKYLGCRSDQIPSYFDFFSLNGETVTCSGEYHDYDESNDSSVRFNVHFIGMTESKILAILEKEYNDKLLTIAEKAAKEKAAAEEKKRLAREKKIEREKEKLKELLTKYYPDAIN